MIAVGVCEAQHVENVWKRLGQTMSGISVGLFPCTQTVYCLCYKRRVDEKDIQ
jgi:hypothetical protein